MPVGLTIIQYLFSCVIFISEEGVQQFLGNQLNNDKKGIITRT